MTTITKKYKYKVWDRVVLYIGKSSYFDTVVFIPPKYYCTVVYTMIDHNIILPSYWLKRYNKTQTICNIDQIRKAKRWEFIFYIFQ